jgi:hypothetical protein
MSITKLHPVWVASGRPSSHDLSNVRPYTPPPRVIVGLLTGDGELAQRDPADRRRGER